MEKIDLLGGAYAYKPPEEKKTKKKGALGSIFSSVLSAGEKKEAAGTFSAEEGDNTALPLEKLLDSIHESGEMLKENATLDRIENYKKSVRRFIKRIVDSAYAIEKKTSGKNILNRKIFYTVTVIDQKLEALAAGILQNQRAQLDILRRVNEIEGLCVDLLS